VHKCVSAWVGTRISPGPSVSPQIIYHSTHVPHSIITAGAGTTDSLTPWTHTFSFRSRFSFLADGQSQNQHRTYAENRMRLSCKVSSNRFRSINGNASRIKCQVEITCVSIFRGCWSDTWVADCTCCSLSTAWPGLILWHCYKQPAFWCSSHLSLTEGKCISRF
jgi:hypothetical protein